MRTGSRVILGKNHVFRYPASFPALLHHLFRFHHPEKARRGEEQGPTDKAEGKDLSPTKDAESKADWDLAHSELLELEGVDLKVILYAL